MGLRERLAVRPVAFGANCGIGPAQLVESVLGLARAADAGDVIVAKGNCGVPQYHDGQIHYDGTPEIMAAYACLARDAGARVIGGCCGTTADHVRAMVAALAGRPPGPPPSARPSRQRSVPWPRRRQASRCRASAVPADGASKPDPVATRAAAVALGRRPGLR